MKAKTLYLELVDGKKLVEVQNQMNGSGFQRIKATTIFQRNAATGVYDAFIYYDEDDTYGKTLQKSELPKIQIKPIPEYHKMETTFKPQPTITLTLPSEIDKDGFDIAIIEERDIIDDEEQEED